MTDLGLNIPPTYILCMDRVGGMFLYEGAVIFILRRNIFFADTNNRYFSFPRRFRKGMEY